MQNIRLNKQTKTIKIINRVENIRLQHTGKPGPPGVGVPRGGVLGDVLAKASSTDFDTEWVDLISTIDQNLFRSATFTVTVGTGGDYSTINAAITALSRMKPLYTKGGFLANIRLLSGFTMSEQILVKSVDLSWITITSVDAEVPVNTASITIEFIDEDNVTPIIGGTDNAKLPIIATLFAYPDQGDGYATSPMDGVVVSQNSQVLFKPGAGVKRPRNGLKVLYGSSAICYMPGLTQGGGGSGAGTVTGVNFSYATGRAIMVSYGSKANLARSIVHHSNGDYAIYVIWGSHGDFYQSQAYDSVGNAITCRDGSFANMRETQVARSKRGYHALHNGRIDARSHNSPTDPAAIWRGDSAKNCVEYGVLASYNSHIDATEVDVSGSATGVNASNASSISFTDNSLAENCSGTGVSALTGSTIDATGASTNGSGTGFAATYGSTISADTSTANNCTIDGYRADETSTIQARNSSANNCANYGFNSNRSSNINARGSSATGCLIGFIAFEGSKMNAQSTVATGASSFGYSVDRGSQIAGGSISGTTNQPVNSLTGKGLISDSSLPMAADSTVVHIAGSETITGTKKFAPANGAASFQITRADGTTNVVYIDTTSSTPKMLIGVGSTPGSVLNVNGPSYFGGGAGVATSFADFAASTVASASARFRAGVDPTSPNTGEMWFDGTDLKFRNGSTTQLLAPKSYVDAGDATKQPLDSTLTALAAYNTNGLLTQTASDTFTGRTITGTANQVIVTNGNGVSGNPTLSLPQDIATTSTPTLAGLIVPITGANGFTMYNTVDQTTNYERGTIGWVSDIYKMQVTSGGTGNIRQLALQANDASTGNVQFILNRNASPFLRATHSSTSATRTVLQIDGTSTASSSTYTSVAITPTINQSSTGAYTALLVNPTETSIGSGAKNLMDLQLGSSSKFKVDNNGAVTLTNTATTRALTPSATNTYDLGSSSFAYRTIYLGTSAILSEGTNIQAGTTTGTKIGTATTQKLGFFNATPVVQPVLATDFTYSVTNGTIDRTFDANSTTIDELADVVYTQSVDLTAIKTVLKNLGLLA